MNMLAVDDERISLQVLVNSIQDVYPDSNLQAFRSGYEAIEYAKSNVCDIAFLDIEMRDINGLELAKQLKDINGNINIIFVTGYSDYALDAFGLYASGYMLKPATGKKIKEAINHLRFNASDTRSTANMYVQTFGGFEVFKEGKPVAFKRKKSKELFAYLIDRKGSISTMEEIASVLWDDGIYNLSRNNQIHSFLHDLIKTLDDIGQKEIIIRQRNGLAVDAKKIKCDLYRCLDDDPAAINAYHGEYMSQYSWAEFTAGALTQKYL